MSNLNEMVNKVMNEDCMTTMSRLPNQSINCCMTSPPYWALRDYGTGKDQLGLEPTFDLYINNLCDIFDEVKRVLRDDGTVWINIGDTYGQNWRGSGVENASEKQKGNKGTVDFMGKKAINTGVPPKSLTMIPFRFAIAMVDRGWILRNTIIWHKKNCMPSSVKDRFTVDYEYLFFFSKNKKYYFNQQFELQKAESYDRLNRGVSDTHKNLNVPGQTIHGMHKSRSQGQAEYLWNKQGRNKRTVWTINPTPFSEAHFACVDEKTEMLTINGWKNYKVLIRGEKVATFNQTSKIIEYQPLSYIKEYAFDGELYKIGNRDLGILLTHNHRNVVKKRMGEEKIVLTENLAYSDKIRVSAPIDYPENNGVGKTFAELIGWIISEGHYKITKYKAKRYKAITIYQNEGENAKRIDYLLHKLEIPNNRKTRNRNNKLNVEWYLPKSPLIEWILTNVTDKQLNKFLVSLPKVEAKALFVGLIGGDGHTRKDDGRISFIQKNQKTRDWFQILALRVGYHSIAGKDIYLTKREFIGIRNTDGDGKAIKKVRYKGKIWCPKTPTGTWIARRNGRIFITGNTYPEELCETPIKAGCPEFVCKKCGKPRETIYKKDTKSRDVEWHNEKYGDDDERGKRLGRLQPSKSVYRESKFVGLTDCGCNAGFTSGIVYDLFAGSGTTGLVAYRLNRNYILSEIKKEYCEIAEKRLSITKQIQFT